MSHVAHPCAPSFGRPLPCKSAFLPIYHRQVPKPRVNLTRLYGVFAPNSKYRVDESICQHI